MCYVFLCTSCSLTYFVTSTSAFILFSAHSTVYLFCVSFFVIIYLVICKCNYVARLIALCLLWQPATFICYLHAYCVSYLTNKRSVSLSLCVLIIFRCQLMLRSFVYTVSELG